MSKKKKKRQTSSLKQHKRQGNKLSPPFMTIPNMQLTYWLRDDLPEMLWLVMLCAKYQERGMVMARKLFDTVEQLLKEEFGDMKKVPKDILVTGRLNSFDTLPDKLRPKLVQRLKLIGAYEVLFPREFGVALSRYDSAPAKWLWEYTAPAKGFSIADLDKAETMLKQVVEEAWSGKNQISTWAKMAVTSAMFSSGRVHLTPAIADDWAELLPKYPNQLNEDQIKRVESSMRAFYQAVPRMPDEDGVNKSVLWAKEFWRSNWKLYDCERADEPKQMDKKSEGALHKFEKHVSDRLATIKSDIESTSRVDPDLYSPERYEVISGIVARALRAVTIATLTPSIWSTEHGSGLIRSLVESKIVLAWLLHKDDPALYDKFKEFGRGHLKLLKLQLEEYLDKQSDPNPDLKEYIEALEIAVDQDVSGEFQNIQLGGNFAGNTNTRKMAIEVGLLDEYQFMFAPASSSFHGEWPAIDQFALELCSNPLHRGHRLPRLDASIALGPQLIELALDQLEDLAQRYKGALQASK